MQGHFVVGSAVNSLDDIYLPCVRPVRAVTPPGWPSSASSTWHVRRVENEKPVGEGFTSLDSNALSSYARTAEDGCMINADIRRSIVAGGNITCSGSQWKSRRIWF
jgi:hypothetical protein